MPTPVATRARKSSLDETSNLVLYEGANMSQMEALFKMDYRTIKERIHGVKPCGVRGGSEIWKVHEVVPRLYKPTAEQFQEMIPRLKHTDLPKELTKEFWAGQRSRQAFEREEGDLWPTAQVVEVFSRFVKLVKQRVQLRLDAVDRQMELPEPLRQLLKSQDDGFLREMQSAIMEEFKDRAKDVTQHEEDDGEL